MQRVRAQMPFGGAERWTPDRSWDVVVVGVPSSGGALATSHSALGPKALRRMCRVIAPTTADGPVDGWYDYTTGRMLCEGLTLADAGDLVVDRMAALTDLEQLAPTLAAVEGTCKLLLLLLGDDSLTYWAHRDTRGLLVHLDAHEDAAPPRGPHPNHADFMRFLERSPDLAIGQLGLRGLVPGRPEPPSKRRRALRDDATLRDWLDREPADVATLALDVDVLDPSLLRSVAAPVPDGWRTDDVVGVVRAIRVHGKRVARLSVAEFSPTPGDDADIDAMRLVHLLLRAIDEIMRP